tara:strand:- start:246 stop:644 length:399 start_codon:yes stop_codon:yes gene_type:complete
MKDKDLNKIAAIEKAISEKYGEEAVANPMASWDEEREKDYLKQMKKFYTKIKRNEEHQEKIDINGIKVSKKLLNRESLKNCPVCGSFPKVSMDDVCFIKFGCCSKCYDRYIFGREERWLTGWRPNENHETKT